MKKLSISDDDLCSTCEFYHSEMNGFGGWCDFNFPCEKYEDGYAVSCEKYQKAVLEPHFADIADECEKSLENYLRRQ